MGELERLRDDREHHMNMLDGACRELERLGMHPDEYGGEANIITCTKDAVDEVLQLRGKVQSLLHRAEG